MNDAENAPKSILEHVGELRKKIFIAVTAVVLGTVLGHILHKKIISLLLLPIGENKLIFLSPLEPLIFILKIDIIFGIIVSFPVLIWCIFSYIKPILPQKTASLVSIFYISSFFLLLLGFLYSFFITIPISLKFLFSIVIPGIENQFSAQSYISFFITQALIIMGVFQIPIIIVGGIKFGILKTKTLSSKRRFIYLILAIALAILTPTSDIFSLLIVLIPCLVIFEGSLIVGKVFEYAQRRKK